MEKSERLIFLRTLSGKDKYRNISGLSVAYFFKVLYFIFFCDIIEL